MGSCCSKDDPNNLPNAKSLGSNLAPLPSQKISDPDYVCAYIKKDKLKQLLAR